MTPETVDFDTPPPRQGTDSLKWSRHGPDVLPLWIADMDFAVAPCITRALRHRIDHPVFGYATSAKLRDTVVDRLQRRYAWTVDPDAIVFLPGVVPGIHIALRGCLTPGDRVAVHLPAYPPMLAAPTQCGLRSVHLRLHATANGWTIDTDALAAAQPNALLLCHPHNPTGTVFDHPALRRIADACLAQDTLILSDEIHCDLLYGTRRHIPIAALDAEVARRTITLISAGKTFNIAGLSTACAVIPDPGLRARFITAADGIGAVPNPLGLVATEAAYTQGEAWHVGLLAYLQANRDHLRARLAGTGITPNVPDATFLAWLDCRAAALPDPPDAFFLREARVALVAGTAFDPAARHHARLNFACTRATLDAAIIRMLAALHAR